MECMEAWVKLLEEDNGEWRGVYLLDQARSEEGREGERKVFGLVVAKVLK